MIEIHCAPSFEELSSTTYLGNLSKPIRIQCFQVRYNEYIYIYIYIIYIYIYIYYIY